MFFNLKRRTILISCFLSLILLTACSRDNTGPELPVISILPKSINEGNNAAVTSDIRIELSHVSSNTITLSWSTRDSSARAGFDYIQVSDAKIQINPGETSATFQIGIISDTIMEFTEQFILSFESDENAELEFSNTIITILDGDLKKTVQDQEGFETPGSYPGMVMEWTDDFEGTALNEADWNYESGGGGWGNNELEVYTRDSGNVLTENGFLVIRAVDEGSGYTSGRLTTQNKKVFTYGLIEIRAKLPEGQGIWPALWMLGTSISNAGWPTCGEIDIMELVGHQPQMVYGTAHYEMNGHKYSGNYYSLESPNSFSDKYHIFSILWEYDRIVWFVDYNPFYEIIRNSVGAAWPFNNSFFFIFNIAVGGNWPGNPDESTIFPQSMSIDYVRVYKPAD